MAKRYGELVQELWSGNSKSITPLKFRVSMSRGCEWEVVCMENVGSKSWQGSTTNRNSSFPEKMRKGAAQVGFKLMASCL